MTISDVFENHPKVEAVRHGGEPFDLGESVTLLVTLATTSRNWRSVVASTEDAAHAMRLSIEVMNQSNSEPRGDSKIPPKVGTVLLTSEGESQTAFRGEFRDGDHAEYTLLERKNPARSLGGATLFTTLEPCAPGARSSRKTSCAERIVAARISTVWVGIEDPDPTVDRRGIVYLQRHGVEVRMFDSDLQEEIRQANKSFISQAAARAMDVESESMALSDLDAPSQPPGSLDLLSQSALDKYAVALGFKSTKDSAFQETLMAQGLLELQDSAVVPTGFGLLLFGQRPRNSHPGSGLLATLQTGAGEEVKDFDGPLVDIPEAAMAWASEKLPDPIDRSGAVRRHKNEPLFEIIREGIANALVHRDYDIEGARCLLTISDETVEVRSPGEPVTPITLDQMRSLRAPSLSRNPRLHFVFSKLGLAEERGLGLKTFSRRAAELALPAPTYEWDAPYLSLVIPLSPEAVLTEEQRADLSSRHRLGWEWLVGQPSASTREYAEALDMAVSTAQKHMARFQRLGLIRQIGRGRNTRYAVVPSAGSTGNSA